MRSFSIHVLIRTPCRRSTLSSVRPPFPCCATRKKAWCVNAYDASVRYSLPSRKMYGLIVVRALLLLYAHLSGMRQPISQSHADNHHRNDQYRHPYPGGVTRPEQARQHIVRRHRRTFLL